MSGTNVAHTTNRLPQNKAEKQALERVRFLRLLSAWGAVAWFPLVLVLISTGRADTAIGLGIAGAVFSGLLRLAVAVASCPRCERRYMDIDGGLREIWQRDHCANCGLRRYAQ